MLENVVVGTIFVRVDTYYPVNYVMGVCNSPCWTALDFFSAFNYIKKNMHYIYKAKNATKIFKILKKDIHDVR